MNYHGQNGNNTGTAYHVSRNASTKLFPMLPVRRAIQLQRTMRLEMLQQMSCATSEEGY